MSEILSCSVPKPVGNAIFFLASVIGMIPVFVPAFSKIWSRKSSLGVNLLVRFLTLQTYFFLNVASLSNRWDYISCCGDVGFGRCVGLNLPTLQMFALIAFTIAYYFLCLWYFPMTDPRRTQEELRKDFRKGVFGLVISIVVHSIAIFSFFIAISRGQIAGAKRFGNVMGVFAVFTVAIAWMPQAYTTYKNQSLGSLSWISITLSCVGEIVLLFYHTVINEGNAALALPFFVEAVVLGLISAMGFAYTRKDWTVAGKPKPFFRWIIQQEGLFKGSKEPIEAEMSPLIEGDESTPLNFNSSVQTRA